LCLIENVSLSDWYCLPNKLFEYAFSGIPVIASNFPEMTRVIHKHGLGKCVEPSKDSVSELFDEIVSTTQLNAIAKFENLEELSWAAQEEKAKTIYLEML
jgi:glycosyltransferase involved in cell wall biosynthesis